MRLRSPRPGWRGLPGVAFAQRQQISYYGGEEIGPHSADGERAVAKAKMTSKGQVTIPKDVRERLGLRPGDEIEFVEDRRGFRLQKRVPVSPFKKHRGYLKHVAGHDPDELVGQMRGR
jgi:AbrB family looped-hinge helix DNA binding protein